MRRLGTFLFCGSLVGVMFGCNAILENEPGRLDRGASAVGDGGASPNASNDESGEGAEPISGGGEEGNTGTGATGSSGGGGGRDATAPDVGTACTPGSKACGDLCVSLEDPFFGCADPACVRCEVPNATAACAVGACAVGACAPGFADCNALAADGCETDLQTVTSCGACGLACPVLENVAMSCVGGACTGTCNPGFADCNGDAADGCEKDLMKDRRNCGACGVRCVFSRCEQGTCVAND